jgi:hypothetical protein
VLHTKIIVRQLEKGTQYQTKSTYITSIKDNIARPIIVGNRNSSPVPLPFGFIWARILATDNVSNFDANGRTLIGEFNSTSTIDSKHFVRNFPALRRKDTLDSGCRKLEHIIGLVVKAQINKALPVITRNYLRRGSSIPSTGTDG